MHIRRARLLLLDEPANHLDLDAVLWLEEYMATQWHNTCLIVSHDADFLDAVCTNILNVDDMKLNAYSGSYGSFLKMKNQHLQRKIRIGLQQKTHKISNLRVILKTTQSNELWRN